MTDNEALELIKGEKLRSISANFENIRPGGIYTFSHIFHVNGKSFICLEEAPEYNSFCSRFEKVPIEDKEIIL